MWLHRNRLTDILFVGFLVSFSSVFTNESSCPTVRASNALHNESNNNNFHFFSSVFSSLLTFHLHPLISFCVTFLTFTSFLRAYLLLSPFMFCSTPLWPSLTFCFITLLFCRVWEVKTGEVLNTLIHHNEAVLHLRFANGLMVTCSKDRSIAVWDMASPTDISLRRVLVGHRAAVNVVDFDDKYIVSASGDRTIKVKFIKTRQGHLRHFPNQGSTYFLLTCIITFS